MHAAIYSTIGFTASMTASSYTPSLAVTIWPRGDDEPQDDGRGVREPRRPPPAAPSTGAAPSEPSARP